MGEERNKINIIMELFEPNVRKLLTYFTMNFSSSDYYSNKNDFDDDCD